MAAVALVAALLVAPIRGPLATGSGGSVLAEHGCTGFGSSLGEPRPRALIWLLGLQAMAIGVLDVLYVVLAVAVLGHEGGTAGYLNAAFGAGGVLGVLATVAARGQKPAGAAPRRRPPGLGCRPRGDRGCLVHASAPWYCSQRPAPGRHRARRRRTHAAAAACSSGGARPRLRTAGECVDGGARNRLGARPRCLVAVAGGGGAFVCLALLLPVSMLLVFQEPARAPTMRSTPIVEMARLRALPFFAPLGAPEARSRCRPRRSSRSRLRRHDGHPRRRSPGIICYVVADGEVEVTVGTALVEAPGRSSNFSARSSLIRERPWHGHGDGASACGLDVLDEDSSSPS